MKRLRASVVCVNEGKLLVVKYCDPVSKHIYWGVPGGRVEPGEEPAHTAQREALEETGYGVKILIESHFVNQYLYLWAGQEVECTTHWFSAVLTNPGSAPTQVNDADYILETGWLPVEKIRTEVNYHPAVTKTVLRLAGF